MTARTPCFRRCSWGLFGIAWVLPALALTVPISAAPKRPYLSRTAPDGATSQVSEAVASEPVRDDLKVVQPERKVRINYVRTSWSKVLGDYAQAVDKQLVADVVPQSPYSRLDPRQHSEKTAFAILNSELGKLGYKLIEKGAFLVLLQTKQTRTDYPPAEIARPEDDLATKARQSEIEQTAGEAPPKRRMQTQAVRSATHEEPAAETAQPKASKRNALRLAAAEESEDAPQIELTQTNVRLKARDAVTVSRTIYNAFKAQAELVDEGPRGLQGFRVFRVEIDKQGKPLRLRGDQTPRFAVYIDEDRNQLVIEATPAETQGVLKFIKMLDRLPSAQQPTVRAVATGKDAGLVAESLQPELDRLTHETRREARRGQKALLARNRGEELDDEDADRLAQNEPGVPRGAAPPAEGGAAEGLAGSLKGDVSVEAVPDLGILIIRGNQQDVESVMQVIREIERLSVGAAPQIQLLTLRNVSSESLAPLLGTVYDRLNPARGRPGTQPQQQQQQGQSSSIIAIVRPNAVLIIAAEAEMEAIVDLAEKLDQPVDPTTDFRVFRLKHAVATQVAATLGEMYDVPTGAQGQQQASQARGPEGALAPKLRVVADPRTNSIIVQARPRDMQEVAQFIGDLDSAESEAVSKIKIFPLKNAVADELAASIMTAIQNVLTPARITSPTGQGGQQQFQQGGQGQGQAAQEVREVRSQILEYLGVDGTDDRAIRSGILSDIRISSDPRTNSIVVTAPEQSMELVAALIRQFDQPSAAVAEIKVFSLAQSDATAMLTLLNTLFGIQRQAGQGGQGGQGGQFGNQGTLPFLQVAGADDASSTIVPLRFSTDLRTNSIIAIGGAEALRVVEAVLLRLDESDIKQRMNEVYRLRNSPAADVANAISQFLQTQQQSVQQIDPALLSPFEQIEREVIVVAEPVTNSLLISATPRYFKQVKELVVQLDQLPQQVVIQGLIVEVILENQDEWGVELGLQDSILFNRSLIAPSGITTVTNILQQPNGQQLQQTQIVSQEAVPGYLFNNNGLPLGNNTSPGINSKTVGAQGLTGFNLQRINGDLGYGGLVLSAGSESVSALLRAVAARRRIDVLSRPQIVTLNNQIAQIQVGQEVPRVNGFNVNQTTGFAAPVPQQRAVGIILQVTPRISPEGMVVMEIIARKDALSNQSVPLFVNPDGSTVNSPIIDTTNALTTVGVRSGQTVVVGGMITKRDEETERKVPILGDIPVLGQAFRYDFKRSLRTELLIFLTPRVVHNEAEAEMVKEIEIQRINFVEAEAEMLHGPLFGVPAPGWTDPLNPATPAAPSVIPPAPAPMMPNRPAAYMFEDDPSIPTTVVPGELQRVPAFDDENLNIDLSKSRREGNVTPAGWRYPSGASAGRASVDDAPAGDTETGGKSRSKRKRKPAARKS